MDLWIPLVLVSIAVGIVFCIWKNHSFSLITGIVCVFVYIIMRAGNTSSAYGIIDDLGFAPRDIVDPSRFYTVLTSMYSHASPSHLIFNLLGLALIGTIFEQRIGTRRYILIYLITGICGTLAFSLINWSSEIAVVGASGAICGVLGGFARKYGNDRMSILFVPGIVAPVWVFAVLFVALQILIVPFNRQIAVESHLTGMLAGFLITPYVLRLRTEPAPSSRKAAPIAALRKLATTPELKSELAKIEAENIPDVRNAWIEHFLSVAKCPHCGASLKVTRDSVKCERGHLL